MRRYSSIATLAIASLFAFTPESIAQQISCSTHGMEIDVTFYSPSIVRVLKHPKKISSLPESMVVVKKPEDVVVKTHKNGNIMTAASDIVSVSVNTKTGAVEFTSPDGKELLTNQSTSFTPEDHNGTKYNRVKTSFILDEDEPVYGIGQVMDGKFNRRNSSYHLQNENMFTYSPYFMSPTKGYGVYLDNYSISDYTDNNQLMEFSQLGDSSDYYFIYGGDSDGVIAGIRDLTGKAPMIPLWAYGYFQSKERYATQQESLDVLKRYRKIGIPIDCMIQDWRYWPQYNGTDSLWNCQTFDPANFPDPKKWVDDIHKLNAKLMIVTWPGFGPKTPQYKEQNSKGHIIDFLTFPPQGGTRPYDVYSEDARDIYWKYLNDGIFSKIGNDGWWLDSTEPDHNDVKDTDFELMTAAGPYRGVKNAFSINHNKGIAEHQKNQNRDKRVTILTRSGFVGQQRFGSNTWSGDVESNWETLTNHIPAALNFTLMGLPNWNSDIGGFWGRPWYEKGGTKNPEYRELYTRWAQFGAFCPMMRSHGTGLPREIWQFGEPGEKWYDAIADIIRLRYRLLPYIYSTSWDVSSNDGTFMRPLVMDYASDSKTHEIGNQYLFGRNILVSPVTRQGVSTWDVYLPEGNDWWDFWTNRRISGGTTDKKDVPANIIPLYVKAGSIIPFGPDVQYSTEKKWDNLEIRIYSGTDGSFTLYEDEFDNYNYENGKYSEITFNWNDADHTLSISDRNGNYPGMLKNRKFRFTLVDSNSPSGASPAKGSKTVSYNGKAQVVRL